MTETAAKPGTTGEQTKFWLGFSRTPYIGPTRIRRLVDHFGDLERAWSAPVEELATGPGRAGGRESGPNPGEAFDSTVNWSESTISASPIVGLEDAAYPRLLREIPAPPPVLFVKGRLLPEDDVAVAIVGTRRSTRLRAGGDRRGSPASWRRTG